MRTPRLDTDVVRILASSPNLPAMNTSSLRLLTGLALVSTLLVSPATAAGPGKRILAGDDSTRRLAIVAPDGSLEWEIPVTAIHDAAVLPNGNVLLQQGWTRVQEVTPDRKVVWEYDAAKANAGKPVEVHAFQRLPQGLTMVVESGPARIIEIDRNGRVHR